MISDRKPPPSFEQLSEIEVMAQLRRLESGKSSAPEQPAFPGPARQERPLQKCVVTHFDARGPREPLKPWGCAAVGAPGVLWNLGDAF